MENNKFFTEVIQVSDIYIDIMHTILTLSPQSTTIVLYANSLDLNETPSNSVSYPDPSCLTLRQHFHQIWTTLEQFENGSRRKI